MTGLSLWLIISVTVTFFLAGMVKGVTGMGLPTVAMGVLGAIMSPIAAAALLLIPSFVTNVWQLMAGPSFVSLIRRLWPMMIAVVIGTIAGSTFIVNENTRWAAPALGVALIIYAAYTLLARQISVPADRERWLSPLAGLITGVVTGGTGVFVIPAVPYLQALGLSKDDLIQALGLSFTVSTGALAVGLGWHGAFQMKYLIASAIAIVPALLGMWVGQVIRTRISPVTFRRWFLICLLILGAELASRAFR